MYFIGETLRIGGRNWSDYRNKVLGKIFYYPMPDKDRPDTIRSRNEKSDARKIILLLELMSASIKYTSVPNIYLSIYRMLKTNLSKSRCKYGKLKICNLSEFELQQVISVLGILQYDLLNKGDTKPIIDTVCSRIATGFRYDFMEGTIAQLFHPHSI